MPGRQLGIRQCVMRCAPLPLLMSPMHRGSEVHYCRLLTYSIYQRRRPKDNNIEFWSMFTLDYFVERATIRFDYMNMATGEPRCFEPCMEVLPRLLKVQPGV